MVSQQTPARVDDQVPPKADGIGQALGNTAQRIAQAALRWAEQHARNICSVPHFRLQCPRCV
jgi:hypothetical protein